MVHLHSCSLILWDQKTCKARTARANGPPSGDSTRLEAQRMPLLSGVNPLVPPLPLLPQWRPVFPQSSPACLLWSSPAAVLQLSHQSHGFTHKVFHISSVLSSFHNSSDRASLLPLFMKEETMDDRAGDLTGQTTCPDKRGS